MVQCVHVVLNKALEHAVEEKLILVKPAKKCKKPKERAQSDENFARSIVSSPDCLQNVRDDPLQFYSL